MDPNKLFLQKSETRSLRTINKKVMQCSWMFLKRLYTDTKAIVLIAKYKETDIVIAANMEKMLCNILGEYIWNSKSILFC